MKLKKKAETVKAAWSKTPDETLKHFAVEQNEGLNRRQVPKNREQYGTNIIRKKKKKSAIRILTEQFKSIIILLLGVAGGLSFAFSEIIEGFAIIAVIILNTLIGFFTELRAVRSMEALQKLSSVKATVRRDGHIKEIDARKLVPGDIVIIGSGDIIPADIRILEANKLQTDESALTGESMPVRKTVDPVDEKTELAERKSMLYKGTAVTRGSGEGIIIHTGMDTELGEISRMVEEAEEERTPLEKRLNKLGRKLIWVTLAVAVAMAAAGIIAGKEPLTMIKTTVALVVASIPEGLPIVATIALARGMHKMARKNALVNRLSSVETLGATTIIATDKTGTLTENKMFVTRIDSPSPDGVEETGINTDRKERQEFPSELIERTIKVGVLCNNAELQDDDDGVGEPLEVALLSAGRIYGIERSKLLEEIPEEKEIAFDSDTKMMGTIHKKNGSLYYAVKGAPEAVLGKCTRIRTDEGVREISDSDKKNWIKQNAEMAESGLRIIAVAEKETDSMEEVYQNLTYLGLVGLLDPPRQDIEGSIAACHAAGIRVLMVTGDQRGTAKEVGKRVGIYSEKENLILEGMEIDEYFGDESKHDDLIRTAVFSRVNPKQKLDIIELHQNNGEIVAMTGDGVNDAPALKKADIGVSMGQRGTEVAREASDMVLKDDAFSSIVTAVNEGRIIFTNIRKFVIYLLSSNLSEILTVGLASFFAIPLPLLPLQILFLNVVTNVFPALALGVGEGEHDVMSRKARDPSEPVISSRHWRIISVYSTVIMLSVLGSLIYAREVLGFTENEAVTVSFLTLAFTQIWHVFNMRERGSNFFRNDITRNTWVWGAIALCIVLLLAAVYVPLMAEVLSIVPPTITGWITIIAFSLITFVFGQLAKSLAKSLGPMT